MFRNRSVDVHQFAMIPRAGYSAVVVLYAEELQDDVRWWLFGAGVL